MKTTILMERGDLIYKSEPSLFTRDLNDLEPINCWSRSPDEIGRLLSNFAHTPFELDGVCYGSVEGFCAARYISDPVKKAKIAMMWGTRAKRKAPKPKPAVFDYKGRKIKRHSPEDRELLRRAIAAKLDAHPEIARALVATRPRPVIHVKSAEQSRDPNCGKGSFARILTELREEFATRREAATARDDQRR